IGGGLSQANLEAISSPDAYYSAANFSDLETTVQNLVNDLCGGTITVNKYIGSVSPNNRAGTGYTFDVAGTHSTTDSNGQTQPVEVTPGSGYSVTETGTPAGFSFTSADCHLATGAPVGSPITNGVGSITVGVTDVISCDVINTAIPQTGTINIVKNGNGINAQDFGFDTTGGLFPDETSSPDFSLDDDSNPTLPNPKPFTGVPAGTYLVDEVGTAGWTLGSIVCSDPTQNSTSGLPGAPTATINLAPGETVNCTFTNTLNTGSIKVNKLADTNGDGEYADT